MVQISVWESAANFRIIPQVTHLTGDPIPSVVVFWFAWQAFYPDTALWEP